MGKRQGAQPRGGHLFADFRDEFKGGKVTLAAASFLNYRDKVPNGHFTLWLEEQKLPEIEVTADPKEKK